MLEILCSESGKGRLIEVGVSNPGERRPSDVAGETGAGAVEARCEDREERPREADTGVVRYEA